MATFGAASNANPNPNKSVEGCDASILIDSTQTTQSEKDAFPNQSVRGFDLIDEAKSNLEAICPRTVSCADIITLATRDSVALAGGPNYTVPTGRRDGLVSDPNLVNLPGPSLSVSQALQFFTAKKLTLNDMVTLLGAHTVGVAHCGFFQDRLSNFQGSGKPDPTMDPTLVSKLFKLCGTQSRPLSQDPTTFLDQNTSFIFDNEYYHQIKLKRGVMQIDQELALDKASAPIVTGFASNAIGFQQGFAKAIVKMGGIEVLVGNNGEIRKNCRVFN
ncbi:peroxidase 44-like [Camellia sinensis]|uniref:peroxidase 44-like n=1 Tax=Camellia sinensis TaxID=4442 RepID=UPI001035E2F9|nr:peroxidase 44-like [Camellia sinensis]